MAVFVPHYNDHDGLLVLLLYDACICPYKSLLLSLDIIAAGIVDVH